MQMRLILAAGLCMLAGCAEAQSNLEVSTVKPHPKGATCRDTRVLGSIVEIGCFPLEQMLREGLNVLPFQISGGPDWVRHDEWDIVAKDTAAAGKREEDIYREVLMAVARERFNVKLREEVRPAKGFALTVAHAGTLGPSLVPASGQPYEFDMKPGPTLIGRGISMADLAGWLKWPAGAGRVVEDRTGLRGLFDVTLHWTPQRADTATDAPATAEQPDIFTALQEQLGLKLVTIQVQQTTYVVESAERPTDN